MSDFLTNLAARALGVPTLRPRTRSRFEPEPNASPWLTAPASEASEREAEPPAPGMRARAVALPDAEIERTIVPQAARETRTVAPVPSHEAPAVRETAPPADAPRSPHTSRVEIRQQSNSATHTLHHTTERIVDRGIEHRDTTILRVETRPAAHPAPEAPLHPNRAVPEPPHQAAEPRRPDEQPPRETAPRHRHDEQPPRLERDRGHREPPLAAMLREPRPAPEHPRVEAMAAPEPVIHVSIGRVEVRAAVPAAQPQRPRTHNAPMTLEEYAAKRAKGRP